MANIDYVTSHQGQAHITTQNVIDLLAGLSGDVRGIKKFPQLYNGLSHEITDALTIQVKTGAALAGGSFFILEDAYDWLLDPGTVGYSRIDILFLVMYEDPDTSVQTCDFVYEIGNLYPNGTTGTAPDAPTGANITATYPFLRMDMTDGSIVSVTDYAQPYLSNSSLVETVNDLVEQLEQNVGGTVEQVNTNTNDIAQMKVTFQDGVDAVYNAVVAEGVTPSASTPTAIADAIATIRNGGTAGAAQILSGYSAYSGKTLKNGSMFNRGAWSDTGTGRSNVTIPQGYHNGSGYVNGIGKWDAGRDQGHADETTHTLKLSGNVRSGNATASLYYDSTPVMSIDFVEGDPDERSKTVYTKFSGMRW